MIITIIVLCLFIIGLILVRLGYQEDYDVIGIIGVILSVCSGVVFVILLITFMTLNSSLEYQKSTYYNLKHQVEYVSKDDIVTSENLRNQVLEMNNCIDKHKVYRKNKFVKDFYSDEIGNLPKLEWKSN